MSNGMGCTYYNGLEGVWAKECENVKKRLEHEKHTKHISVVVVGDGGLNIMNRSHKIMHHIVKSVFVTTHETCAIADRVIRVGKDVIPEEGRGPCDEDVAEEAFSSPDAVEKIEESLRETKMVLIVACLGGWTGSVGAKRVAEIASRMGKFVMAMVIYPFSVEGSERCARAEGYGREIEKLCNKYIPFRNDDLSKSSDMTLDKAMNRYSHAIDQTLQTFISVMDVTYLERVVEDLKDEEINKGRRFTLEKARVDPLEAEPQDAKAEGLIVAKAETTVSDVEVDILKE